jgi:hypothetical protein
LDIIALWNLLFSLLVIYPSLSFGIWRERWGRNGRFACDSYFTFSLVIFTDPLIVELSPILSLFVFLLFCKIELLESNKRSKVSCGKCETTFNPHELQMHMLVAHGDKVVPFEFGGNIENSFVSSQHLKSAGLSSTNNSSILFMRPEATQLLADLQLPEDLSLIIQGPPGSGKSSIVWLWACSMAAISDILWVHLQGNGLSFCARLCGGKIYSSTFEQAVVADVIRNCNCHSIILDGLTQIRIELIGTALCSIRRLDSIGGPRVIAVSSTQVRMAGEHAQQSNIKYLSMDSWTLEQYQASCKNDAFYDQVKFKLGFKAPVEVQLELAAAADDEQMPSLSKDELITTKYHYAGGCARWMFGFDVNQTCADISTHVKACTNFRALIDGTSGPSSIFEVDHLRQMQRGNNFIVSKYVMRELVERCEKSFIRMLTSVSLLRGNPSFDGWVFEMDFLLQIRLMCESFDNNRPFLKLFDTNGNREEWYGVARRIFDSPSELSDCVFFDNTWCIPRMWNQGGYDAVHIINSTSVRFVQVTRAESHGLKLQYMHQFLHELNNKFTEIEIVFVVPTDQVFNVPSYGSVIGRLKGWELSQLKVRHISRTGAHST